MHESGRLDGGVVLKKHLKQSDAVAACSQGTSSKLAIVRKTKDEAHPWPGTVADARVLEFTTEVFDSVRELRAMSASGTDIVKTWLRMASDEQLNVVLQILGDRGGFGSRRLGSEDILEKVLPILVPSVRRLEVGCYEIRRCLMLSMQELTELFVQTFNSYNNGAATVDLTSFKLKIEKEMENRAEGIAPPVVPSNRCTIS